MIKHHSEGTELPSDLNKLTLNGALLFMVIHVIYKYKNK